MSCHLVLLDSAGSAACDVAVRSRQASPSGGDSCKVVPSGYIAVRYDDRDVWHHRLLLTPESSHLPWRRGHWRCPGGDRNDSCGEQSVEV